MNYSLTIKKLRQKLFISQKELAEELNVSVVTVNRWENGKFEPTLKLKRRLNDLFKKNGIIK
ncbi:MAG: helix-turn-helix domain-containing protein [Bacteroidales bacterium]|nr:helix-turn-helix domain-containing protein [Acholeplasmataceae bacterium]